MDPAEPQTWIRKYYPAFDGLRAVAILMVFFCHYGPVAGLHVENTGLFSGVDIFFVLSGFLITGILYDSRNTARYFYNFYVRRALRLFPLLYGFFFAVLLLTPVFHLRYSWYIWTNLLYFSNLLVKGAILGQHGNPTIITIGNTPRTIELGHLWSLCIEEQFYLVWAAVVWVVASRRHLMILSGALIILIIPLRIALFLHDPQIAISTNYIYYSTYTRCDTLLVGAWLALWLRGAKLSQQELKRRAYVAFLASGCLIFLMLDGFLPISEAKMLPTVGYTLFAVAGAGILLRCLDETARLHRTLLHPWLAHLGRISYGFYFFHNMPISIFTAITRRHLAPHGLRLLVLPIAFAFSYGAAYLSFRFLESPFLRLKKVFAPGHRSIPTGMEEQPSEARHMSISGEIRSPEPILAPSLSNEPPE